MKYVVRNTGLRNADLVHLLTTRAPKGQDVALVDLKAIVRHHWLLTNEDWTPHRRSGYPRWQHRLMAALEHLKRKGKVTRVGPQLYRFH